MVPAKPRGLVKGKGLPFRTEGVGLRISSPNGVPLPAGATWTAACSHPLPRK